MKVWSAQCSNHSTTNTCTAWLSNGSAAFGGPYADSLKLYNEYRFRLTYVAISNASATGKQQSSNFVMVDTDSNNPSNTTSTTSGTSASSTSSGASTTSPSSSSSSLSAGAKAGIGVGAAIGALLVLLGIFFLWRQHRQRRPKIGYSGAPTEELAKNEPKNKNSYEGGELDGSIQTTLPAQELDATAYQQNKRPVSELGDTSHIVESRGGTLESAGHVLKPVGDAER